MFTLRKASVAAFGLVVGSVGVVGTGCSSQPVSTDEGTGSSADDINTSDIVARAEQWSTAKLLYCQSANGARDYDSACPSYCHRESNAAWNAYRSDCSGLISYAWGLPAPGRVTSEFAPYENDISTRIDGIDLRPGDALNRIPNSEHIILFKQWVSKGHSAEFIEEPGCGVNPDYAHTFTSNVTISGSSVYVAYEGDTFAAIRYTKSTVVVPDAPARGYLDAASCTTISGWSEDSDTPTKPVTVDLTFDAPLGGDTSGSMVVSANEHRADLCTAIGSCNHAYSVTMPTGVRDGKTHTVYAYGHDLQGNAAALLTDGPKTFKCAPPAIPKGIKRHIVSEASMRSWKFDPLLDVAHEEKTAVDALTTGDALEAAPVVVKGDDGSAAIWVIESGFKRHVVNGASLTAWGFTVGKMASAKLDAIPQVNDWPEAPFVLQAEGETAIYVLDDVPPEFAGSTTVSGNGQSTNDDSTDTATPAQSTDDGQTGNPGDPSSANGDTSTTPGSGCSMSASHESGNGAPLAIFAALGWMLGLRSKKRR
jgi:hypothetical protein